ncbi:hypothetical protein ES703_14347 [subsurface metagenome]
MVSINIRIDAKVTTDTINRYHGLAIDEPLNRDFWNTQPEAKIGMAAGSFSYTKQIELDTGLHTLEYGTSGYCPDYAWTATLYIADVEIATESCIGRDKHMVTNFRVGFTGVERRFPFPFPRRPIFTRLKLLTRIKKNMKLFRTKWV